VLLDWAVVGLAPPAVDLAWYLAVNSARLPISKEATIDAYRDRLAGALGSRFDPAWWQPQLELALLGGFLQLGWPKAFGAVRGDAATQQRERAELTWWSRAVLAGAERLGWR
jgi:aminoglycoside phosphotransferase (APT) family kinase protein